MRSVYACTQPLCSRVTALTLLLPPLWHTSRAWLAVAARLCAGCSRGTWVLLPVNGCGRAGCNRARCCHPAGRGRVRRRHACSAISLPRRHPICRERYLPMQRVQACMAEEQPASGLLGRDALMLACRGRAALAKGAAPDCSKEGWQQP